jgi:formate-dependent nitrite reductase membrane component NrfD
MEATLADGWLAGLTILAMSLGLVVPKLLMDYVSEKRPSAQHKARKK